MDMMNVSLEPTLPLVISAADERIYLELLRNTRFWVQRVLVPAIMTIGIIGNVVTIVIMTSRRMRSSTNNYLAALAIFDFMYLIFVFVLSLSHYPNMSDETHYIYWRIRPFIYMLTDTCSNSSVWITVTFTIERYIAVCHPMKGKILCTESRAKKAIVGVFLSCLAFTFPTPFEWNVLTQLDPTSNKTIIVMDYSDLGNNRLYKAIYYWMTVVFFIFIPFLLLAIFNSFLIRSVHQSKVRRSAMTRIDSKDENSQETKITIMLIAVVILFLICQLPTACHLLYSSLHENIDRNQQDLLSSLGNIFNFLMALNAAGNFILYCLLSKKYRKTFLQLFCPCILRRMTQINSLCYQATDCSNIETDSPCSSGGRRYSNNIRTSRGNSPRNSNLNVNQASPKSSPGKLNVKNKPFLDVPNTEKSHKVVYDDDIDSENNYNSGGPGNCSPCKRALGDPWKKFKRSVASKKKNADHGHSLQECDSKWIVVTAPDMPTSQNSHSIV